MEPKKEKKKGHNWKKGTSMQLTKQEPSGRKEQACNWQSKNQVEERNKQESSGFKKLSNYKTPKKATEYNRQNENQVGSKKLLNYRALQIHVEDLLSTPDEIPKRSFSFDEQTSSPL